MFAEEPQDCPKKKENTRTYSPNAYYSDSYYYNCVIIRRSAFLGIEPVDFLAFNGFCSSPWFKCFRNRGRLLLRANTAQQRLLRGLVNEQVIIALLAL